MIMFAKELDISVEKPDCISLSLLIHDVLKRLYCGNPLFLGNRMRRLRLLKGKLIPNLDLSLAALKPNLVQESTLIKIFIGVTYS